MKIRKFLWLLVPAFIVMVIIVDSIFINGNSSGADDINNQDFIKIAAVGDSITYGSGLERDETYPKTLSSLLGPDYLVHNYGVRSHTAMRTGNLPYVNSQEYLDSLNFNPDIALIMLGSNDSKNMNWRGPMEFRMQYEALIHSYLNNNPGTEIYLMTPPKAFNTPKAPTQIDNGNVDEIVKVVKDIAGDKGYGLIDINALSEGNSQWFERDLIHPDKNGADSIAETVYEYLQR